MMLLIPLFPNMGLFRKKKGGVLEREPIREEGVVDRVAY